MTLHNAFQNAQQQNSRLEEALDMTLCAQGHWFMYARSRVPRLAFDDAYYREMVRRLIDYGRAGGTINGFKQKKAFLNSKNCADQLDSSYLHFKGYFRLFLKDIRKTCKGNLFAQGMHDGVTLDNTEKFLSIGLQVADPTGSRNWVICIGFKHAPNGTSAGVAKTILEKEFLELTGLKYTDVAFDTISDRAALKVAEHFNHFRRACAMHDGDKVGRACNGDLVRTRGGGRTVNPFDDGQNLMKKAQAITNHFSYGVRRHALAAISKCVEGGAPDIVPQTDHCHTRIASRHTMIKSLLRLNKALRMYCANSNLQGLSTSDVDGEGSEWDQLRDIEAVMNHVAQYTTVVQTERYFMRTLGAYTFTIIKI